MTHRHNQPFDQSWNDDKRMMMLVGNEFSSFKVMNKNVKADENTTLP